jgi:hypothetical protein
VGGQRGLQRWRCSHDRSCERPHVTSKLPDSDFLLRAKNGSVVLSFADPLRWNFAILAVIIQRLGDMMIGWSQYFRHSFLGELFA